MDIVDKNGPVCLYTLKSNDLQNIFNGLRTIVIVAVALCTLRQGSIAAPPQGPVVFINPGHGKFDPETTPLCFRDDDGNIYLDVYAIRGQENKIMFSKNGVLIVSIKGPDDIQDTMEKALWIYITSILRLTIADVEILLLPSESARRVIIKKAKITEEECQDRIRDVLKPYIPLVSQGPDQTESPPWMTPYDPVAIYAQNVSNPRHAALKYYEVLFSKENKTIRAEPIPRKKLLEMRPNYNHDTSWMAKLLRDLRTSKGVVFRGRLLPGIPMRPIVDDYRGAKKLKMSRKILEGIVDGSGVSKPSDNLRFEISHPVPAVMVLDYLNPEKTAVVSRRVISPFFRNNTVDLVEEFEYVEVID